MSGSRQKDTRDKKLASIRLNLKNLPIIHAITDRVTKKIKQKQPEEDQEDQHNTSIDFELENSKIQKKHDIFEAKFIIGQKIGQGAHGIVKKCYQKQNNKVFAVKILHSESQFYFRMKENFINIIQLNHPNIIKHKAFYFGATKDTCLLVMDYLPFPSLNEIKIDNENQLRKIIYSVILGIQYIHRENICHRDIKPENILCILIDFGVCCKMVHRGAKKEMLTLTGTPYYRAPEMFIGGGYDQKVDLWALGVLIYKIVTKVTPFESVYHSDTINNILKGQIIFDNEIWDNFSYLIKDLVTRLLKPKQLRLTINQAKNHFWFQELRRSEEDQLTKIGNPNIFFSLKRTESDCNNECQWGLRRPTMARNLNGTQFSQQMFSLEKYQIEEKRKKWLNLQNSEQLDLIGSEQSTIASSPTLKERPKVKRQLTYSMNFQQEQFI